MMLADGRLHLSGIAKIAPHLTEANRETLLARAAHKSKRQIEELIAELSPKPDVPATMRKPRPFPAATPRLAAWRTRLSNPGSIRARYHCATPVPAGNGHVRCTVR